MATSAAVRRAVVLVPTAIAAACLGSRVAVPEVLSTTPAVTLNGQFSFAAMQRYPPTIGLPFGGISGLAWDAARREMFGISDAQRGARIYRFAVEGEGPEFRVAILGSVPLAASGDDGQADFEALGILPGGGFLVASEGTGREPRRPPAITHYGPNGELVGRLPIRDRYVPEPRGPATRGARGNAGFESLAIAADGERFFTAAETSLIQDGEPAGFDRGTRTRLLEYVARRGSFVPAREFVYEIEPLERPASAPGLFIKGLVELLVVDRTTLLALERGYVEAAGEAGSGTNHIRVYRVSLAGATDVSAVDSLKEAGPIVPVRKTLLLDLDRTPGLDKDLAPSLDNFEGIAFGPRLADGRPSLVLVSDDNFSLRQRTWFLSFAIGSGSDPGPKGTKTGPK